MKRVCAIAVETKQKDLTITEAAILEKIVAPHSAFSPDVARELLAFKFDRDATALMRRLLQQNNRGTISAQDRLTLEKYLRVGQFLDLLHAKARLSLRKNGEGP
jgi:hypothetical protein